MRLVQFLDKGGGRCVGIVSDDGASLGVVGGARCVYDIALEAIRRRSTVEAVAREWRTREAVPYAAVVEQRRLLPPLDHVDPARWLVTGTGLSHLGSAAARDAMHAKLQADEAQLTD